ncbi:hypothetical protein HID58_095839 [Brassica napus]|uniref:Endoplasmic reticulum-Golgi intermediate compartment protein 3 n=1 Tax=Brassica napus TaxID=3708 RepID=A0ABQ7X4I2_BRANA|nr:hypothetical protein HID58_095839 [Brassica napus]
MGVKAGSKEHRCVPRAEDHLLQKTQSGAVVSIVGLLIMVTLFLSELSYYLNTLTVHQMSVDLKRGEKRFQFIMDAIDMSGKHEVDLDTNIWKLRLNSHGHIIGTEYISDLVEKEHDHSSHKHDEHKNETDALNLLGFDEAAETMIKKVKQALADGEGCRVYGVLDVQRVAGNFHISVHGLNIYIFGGSKNVNVSHMIHDLSTPEYTIHLMAQTILHDTSGTFKYYIKISIKRHTDNESVLCNGILHPMNEFDRTWPAVYFLYDLSPITVTIKEERRSFLHLITRACAVLGGTFALTESFTKKPSTRSIHK